MVAQQAFHDFTTTARCILDELKLLKSRQRSSPLKDVRNPNTRIHQTTNVDSPISQSLAANNDGNNDPAPTTKIAASSIRAALFELHDIATPLSVVFYNWYYYKCHINEKNFVYKGLQKDPKREARRTKAVISFCYAQTSMEDRNTIDFPPSDTSTTLFETWAGRLHTISTALENSIMSLLIRHEEEKRGDENTVTKFSSNVSAIYQRLEMLGMIKKYAEEPKLATKTLKDMWQ